jgi:predicted DNA-binding WGR domain protein
VEPVVDTGPHDHLSFRRLVLPDAGGEKFWEVAADGRQLIIRRGKTGSKGQVAFRTFPDEGSARDEVKRLWEEQVGKGYVPPA